jgi:hypothetical protein
LRTADRTMVGDSAIVCGRPFFTTHTIVTRGTTCWAVRPPDYDSVRPPDDDSEWPWVLRVSWRYPDRKHEGLILAECRDGVSGIAEYVYHDGGVPPVTVHGVLRQRCVDAAVALNLQWRRDKRLLPCSTSGASVRQKRAKRSHALDSNASATTRTPTNANDPAATSSTERDEPEGADLAETPGIAIPDRIYTRVLLRRGKPIYDFATPVELLLAMRDAVRGHRSLLVDGHVLHRDVSVNNVLITLPTVPRRDSFHGFLLDLDHAITSDALGCHNRDDSPTPRAGGTGCRDDPGGREDGED